MNDFEALEASVTLDEARAELRRHQVEYTVRDDKVLIDPETGGTIAEPDDHGEYAGSDIIDFLGY